VNSKKKEWLTEKKEEEQQEREEVFNLTLDMYFVQNNSNSNRLHMEPLASLNKQCFYLVPEYFPLDRQ